MGDLKQLSPTELKQWLNDNRDFVLIDVREPWEHEFYNIGGMLMPMGDIPSRLGEIPKDKEVVLYCEKGIRSVIAIQRLEGAGYHNLHNLMGGMKAWREAV